MRKRSDGHGLLLALPAAGQLVLAQGALALARLGAGPDGAPCGRPATHVLDGLCKNCWTKNDQELRPGRAGRGGAGPGGAQRELASLSPEPIAPHAAQAC